MGILKENPTEFGSNFKSEVIMMWIGFVSLEVAKVVGFQFYTEGRANRICQGNM